MHKPPRRVDAPGRDFSIPVMRGRMTLGTWQGIYLIEHRVAPHQRTIALSFLGRSSGALD